MNIISTEHSVGGQLTSETNELGNARLYQYDLAGRLTDVYQDAVGVTGNVAGQIDAEYGVFLPQGNTGNAFSL